MDNRQMLMIGGLAGAGALAWWLFGSEDVCPEGTKMTAAGLCEKRTAIAKPDSGETVVTKPAATSPKVDQVEHPGSTKDPTANTGGTTLGSSEPSALRERFAKTPCVSKAQSFTPEEIRAGWDCNHPGCDVTRTLNGVTGIGSRALDRALSDSDNRCPGPPPSWTEQQRKCFLPTAAEKAADKWWLLSCMGLESDAACKQDAGGPWLLRNPHQRDDRTVAPAKCQGSGAIGAAKFGLGNTYYGEAAVTTMKRREWGKVRTECKHHPAPATVPGCVIECGARGAFNTCTRFDVKGSYLKDDFAMVQSDIAPENIKKYTFAWGNTGSPAPSGLNALAAAQASGDPAQIEIAKAQAHLLAKKGTASSSHQFTVQSW